MKNWKRHCSQAAVNIALPTLEKKEAGTSIASGKKGALFSYLRTLGKWLTPGANCLPSEQQNIVRNL